MKRPFLLHKRGDVWYFKLPDEKTYHSTGESVKARAQEHAMDAAHSKPSRNGTATLRSYAEPFYVWETCPHIRRLQEDGRSITRRHVRAQRALLEQKILKDPIAEMAIPRIRRADVLDFRSRLMAKHGPRVVNRTIGVLKVIFKEGIFREDLERDPTLGVGNVREDPRQIGTFTAQELQTMFPAEGPGPWKGRLDYTCFLLAATTGMRRGEIFALRWRHVDLGQALIRVEEAWKGGEETGLPKSGKTRAVPLPAQTVSVLQELQEEAVRIAPDDLVICDDDGKRQDGVWWKRHFSYVMKAMGIDAQERCLRPHSLRHTLNTLLLNGGMDPAKVRAMLGWSDMKMQDNYTHWNAGHLREGAERMAEILTPPKV